jgi:hypothetical protein
LKKTVLLVLLYPLQYLLGIRLPGGQSQHVVVAVCNFQILCYGTIVLFIALKITFVPFYRAMTNNRTGNQWQLSGIQVFEHDT